MKRNRNRMQMSVAMMLAVVAGVALNFWLFRLGALWGILGLNITKHMIIAVLCQNLGVDKPDVPNPNTPPTAPAEAPVAHARFDSGGA